VDTALPQPRLPRRGGRDLDGTSALGALPNVARLVGYRQIYIDRIRAVQGGRRLSPQALGTLQALAADPTRWRHGYDLGQEVGLKAGSLYPILIRLDERGLLESTWERDPPRGRPARHMYRLSPAGLDVTRVEAERSRPSPIRSLRRAW
jgi:PadR family transcriptional regulator PadR